MTKKKDEEGRRGRRKRAEGQEEDDVGRHRT